MDFAEPIPNEKNLSFLPEGIKSYKVVQAKTFYRGDQSGINKVDGLNEGKRMEALSNISFSTNLITVNIASPIIMYQLAIAM